MRFGVLTISDRSSSGDRTDISGPAISDSIRKMGWEIQKTGIIPDDLEIIQKTLSDWADSCEIDVLISTGGTGFAPRDVTPEATRLVLEKLTPGLDEVMRAKSIQITPHGMLSRGVSGIRKSTIIINLPGSPKAAVENLQVIFPVLEHASKLLKNDPESEKGH